MRFLLFFFVLVLPCLQTVRADEIANPIRVEIEKRDGHHSMLLHNTLPIPVTYRVVLDLENAATDAPRATTTLVVPPKSTVRGPLVRQWNPDKEWRWYYDGCYRIGSYLSANTAHVYALPFKRGTRHRVLQGFHGEATHIGREAFAVDFGLRPGTEVTAAREGLVVGVEQRFEKGGLDESLKDQANMVVIAHRDGTLARYIHLQKNSVVVKPGEWVATGTLLGLSGNTGYSSEPHLHFDVCRPGPNLGVRTIKFKFRVDGEAVTPSQGAVYLNRARLANQTSF